MHSLILGAGFSGQRIAQQLRALGTVCGTRRSVESCSRLQAMDIPAIVLNPDAPSVPNVPGVPNTNTPNTPNTPNAPNTLNTLNVPVAHDIRGELDIHDNLGGLEQLGRTTHLIVSVAPAREAPFHDPMLSWIQSMPASALDTLQWIGYLSTIGVYGDHQGRWVDEDTPCQSIQSRSLMRLQAEKSWREFAEQRGIPISILRLSGIYGVGRSAVHDAMAGKARMLIKPQQVFNRIMVDDLATATRLAAEQRYNGILNISDDQPAAPQDVIRFAHQLVGKQAPVSVDFDKADISAMARSFYSENKRVSNARSKVDLGMRYQYPNYELGLSSIWQSIQEM